MSEKINKKIVVQQVKNLWKDSVSTSVELVKIIIPAVIVTKILEEMGMITIISRILEPVMALMGLPGELGLVWATGLLTTLYASIAVFAALAPGLDLTAAQVTVLCSVILIAHTLPVELSITKRAGAGVIPMGILRVGGALVYGIMLHWLCTYTGLWQEPVHMIFKGDAEEKTLVQWALSQVFNIGLIFLVIFCILSLMRVFEVIGFLRLLENILKPVLPIFGMTHRAAPVTVVGMILGIGYGGALIIRETTAGTMSRREIFNSMSLLSLSHSLVEDTLIMMAIGAKFGGIFWGRLLFSLLVLYMMAKFTGLYLRREIAER